MSVGTKVILKVKIGKRFRVRVTVLGDYNESVKVETEIATIRKVSEISTIVDTAVSPFK